MAAKHGFGATFSLHNGTVLTVVADILAITPPNTTVETIDITTHGSAGGFREFMAGLADGGEFSIRINYVPGSAGDTLIAAAVTARTSKAFKINLPAGTGTRDFTGTCIPTGYEKDDVVIDDKMTAVLTAKITGSVTEAVGA